VSARPWYRVHAVAAPAGVNSAERDFVAVLPAALSAAQCQDPFVIGWLSRGDGAPLELITNAGPIDLRGGTGGRAATWTGQTAGPRPAGRAAAQVPPPQHEGMLFPNGARGAAIGDDWLTDAANLVWTACPGRQAPPLAGQHQREAPDAPRQPTLFESTLVTLMGRPFGWFVIAEPTGLIDMEVSELRTQLTALRRFEQERARLDVERAERRMAELDTYR
jgi:uncharacterized protein